MPLINLKELMEGGTTFTVNLDDEEKEPEDPQENQNVEEEMLKQSNLECLGVADEDVYTEGEPFESIAYKMHNLTGNGKIKKRVLREGYGDKPGDMTLVRVDYNAYIEYEARPFDSTYARRRPHSFHINNGEVITGLDIAVQSMQLNEKSQFLIAAEFAYGKLGCLGRVPANATVLFEIELNQIIDASAAARFEQLEEKKKTDFNEVYKYCLALNVKGKDLICNGKNYKAAIQEYNSAVSKLENVVMNNLEEQEKHQNLLLILYRNLLICYTALEEPRKGCRNANKIYEMCKGTNLKITAKVYFNNAKCLRLLGEYGQAEKKLKIARSLEPKNDDINDEFINLYRCMEESSKNEKKMGKALLG